MVNKCTRKFKYYEFVLETKFTTVQFVKHENLRQKEICKTAKSTDPTQLKKPFSHYSKVTQNCLEAVSKENEIQAPTFSIVKVCSFTFLKLLWTSEKYLFVWVI